LGNPSIFGRQSGAWRSGAKCVAVNAFLAFHLISLAAWCTPAPNSLTVAYRRLIRPYVLWSGLFQSWDTFAPSPKTVNSYTGAIVLYRDGTTRNWQFPRMEQLSLGERYFKERYRKYAENLPQIQCQALWPDAARRIARNNNRSGAVKMVLLVQYWSSIVLAPGGSYRDAPWDAHVFYAYTINPADSE
jgi:hypothetical protein